MHFADEAKIQVIAGRGGDGMITYRREKYIAKGGPNGGNGGNGGNIIFRLNPHLNTLSPYRTQKVWKAQNGEGGMSSDKNGKDGEDLVLEVPEGTLIKDPDSGEIIFDIGKENPEFVIAFGGRGGFGNAHFTSSVRQCPDFAEYGDKGEEKELELELKMIADIGIIGFPSVGKSTLISVVSNVKPKIADYPFTTLIPNRGIVDWHKKSLLLCDTPGLIEGASEGRGLGIQFLKHIERTKGLIHLLDGSISIDEIINKYKIIRKELKKYSKKLLDKPEMIVVNKIDVFDSENLKKFEKDLKKKLKQDFLMISAAGNQNIDLFMKELFKFYESHISKEDKKIETKSTFVEETDEEGNIYLIEKKSIKEKSPEIKIYRPHLDDPNNFWCEKIGSKQYKVHGKRIEQIARMTMWHLQGAIERFYDIMEKNNITKELRKLGARNGHKIFVDEFEIEYRE